MKIGIVMEFVSVDFNVAKESGVEAYLLFGNSSQYYRDRENSSPQIPMDPKILAPDDHHWHKTHEGKSDWLLIGEPKDVFKFISENIWEKSSMEWAPFKEALNDLTEEQWMEEYYHGLSRRSLFEQNPPRYEEIMQLRHPDLSSDSFKGAGTVRHHHVLVAVPFGLISKETIDANFGDIVRRHRVIHTSLGKFDVIFADNFWIMDNVPLAEDGKPAYIQATYDSQFPAAIDIYCTKFMQKLKQENPDLFRPIDIDDADFIDPDDED